MEVKTMGNTSLDWIPKPKFATKANGKPASVTLDPVAYVTLLIRGNVTDPALWPPGMQEGAAWLARVRAIEKRCIARHGHFDWEELSRKLQDEYDVLCGKRVGISKVSGFFVHKGVVRLDAEKFTTEAAHVF